MSLAQTKGVSATEYSRLGISLNHVVPDKDWLGVVKDCLRQSPIGEWWRFIDTDTDRDSEIVPLPSGLPGPDFTALEACALQYPQHTLASGLHTTAQWGYEYDYLVNTLTPCLRQHGLRVAAMPAKAHFIGQGIRAQVPPGPYDSVDVDPTSARATALGNECPPQAPGF